MTTIRLVEASRRTQWETFRVQDEFATKFLVNPGIAILSESMVEVILGFREWRPVQYVSDQGLAIGYGRGDVMLEQGMIESEAYAEVISHFRNQQRIVRKQLPIRAIPQSAFDALVSLYIDTGTWRTVNANEGVYDLADAVRNSNWLLAADILMRGNVNPELRQAEARALYLADYTPLKVREQHRIRGLQRIRKEYVAGSLDAFQQKQAEFAYYRQLGAFLPGMTELKQRRVVAQASTPLRSTFFPGFQ